MGMLRRIQILAGTYVSVGMVGLVYAELQNPLIEAAKSGGTHGGFLSDQVAQIDSLVPLVLSLILLGMTLWFVVATVQREKTKGIKQPPR